MKKFPMLNVVLQLIIALTVGLLEKILVFLYCCLPIGLFMLLMSLRTKNHKANAISTFTNINSEFQHIFPNYLLVVIEPSLLRSGVNSKIRKINNFFDKYKWLILFSLSLLFFMLLLVTYCAYKTQ